MRIVPKVGFCIIYHPFEENADKAPEIFKNSLNLLKSVEDLEIIQSKELIKDIDTGISVANYFKMKDVDLICVKLATWSSDEPILEMSKILEVPFIFWTYSHMHAGSLCGGQQFNMVFKELGKECIFVYKDQEDSLNKIIRYSRCIALKNKLRKIRIGIIGKPTKGMTEVQYDEGSVKKILGPDIYNIDLEEFRDRVKQIDNENAETKWQEIKKKVGKVSVNDTDGLNAIKNYFTLRDLIDKEHLNGATIECYPNYMGELCLAFSLLADEGIACACEADINSTILMYILMKLSGKPVHNIDPLYLYEEDNSLLGSHCGCGSFNLASSKESIELGNVRLAEIGVCVLFPSKPGIVTMANLVGKKGTYRLSVIESEAIPTKMEFPGNPIRIKLTLPINDYLEIIEELGIGHHWIIAYGSYENQLRQLANLLHIDFIKF